MAKKKQKKGGGGKAGAATAAPAHADPCVEVDDAAGVVEAELAAARGLLTSGQRLEMLLNEEPPVAKGKGSAAGAANANEVDPRMSGYGFNPMERPVPSDMTGLRNFGNTCFFNSVSQLLGQTAPLVQYLDANETEGRVQGDLSIALCVFVRLLRKSKGSVMEPFGLWKFVCKHHTPFASYAQQDAQELLTFLLVGLEEEYAKRMMAKPNENGAAGTNGDDADADADAGDTAPAAKKKKKKRKTNNIIAKCFRGTFDSVVLCRGCGWRSHKADDYFRDISVEIKHYVPEDDVDAGVDAAAAAERQQASQAAVAARQRMLYLLKMREDALDASAGGEDSPVPASPSSEGAGKTREREALVAGLSKHEAKQVRARYAVETAEAEVRGRLERDEAKAIGAIVAQRPRVLPSHVAACSMKGVTDYMNEFAGTNLVSCLANFFAPETMDGDNKYHCSHCGEKCAASKQLSIASAPQVLTVHLKRFHQDYALGVARKINTHVVFPLALKLDPFLSTTAAGGGASVPLYDDDAFAKWGMNAGDVGAYANFLNMDTNDTAASGRECAEHVYRLFGVIVHQGTMTGGHYFCYVLPYDPETKRRGTQWYYASDSVVEKVSVFQVLAADAYMLMYERV